MKVKQKRAIWYAIRNREREAYRKFIEENNINEKELGLSDIKYLRIRCRKLRELGYNIYL